MRGRHNAKLHAAHYSGGGRVHARKDHERVDGETIEAAATGGFIKGAIKHPGALRASAKKAGESTHEFAEKHKHDSGKTGQRSRLALTLAKLR